MRPPLTTFWMIRPGPVLSVARDAVAVLQTVSSVVEVGPAPSDPTLKRVEIGVRGRWRDVDARAQLDILCHRVDQTWVGLTWGGRDDRPALADQRLIKGGRELGAGIDAVWGYITVEATPYDADGTSEVDGSDVRAVWTGEQSCLLEAPVRDVPGSGWSAADAASVPAPWRRSIRIT